MNLMDMMRSLVHEEERRSSAIHDLGTWLPSSAYLKKLDPNKWFGDFGSDTRSVEEATRVFSLLHGFHMEEEEIHEYFFPSDDEVAEFGLEPMSSDDKTAFLIDWFRESLSTDISGLIEKSA